MALRDDPIIGVVGAGIMGRGIAQMAAQAGARVLLHDARIGAAAEARREIGAVFDKLVARGKLDAGDADAALDRLAVIDDLDGLKPCHIVIEAIVEEITAKQTLMTRLEAIVGADCILASNTSSLSVTAIAGACRKPGRVAGCHFFNPVPLMKLVEVVDGLLTDDATSLALIELAHRMGYRPVRAKDTPGFIVNHAGRGYGTEALRILGDGIADVAVIDAILRDGAGFRMGPFELLDLTGLDVSHPVMEGVYEQYYQEPRYRPSPITRQRLAAGLLGRKTGRGFYDYRDGVKAEVPGDMPPAFRPVPVWVEPAPEAAPILGLLADIGCPVVAQPHAATLSIVTPIGEDATSAALRLGLDARHTVAIEPLFGLATYRTLMATPATTAEAKSLAQGIFAADGVKAAMIHDSPGLVSQRVVATIVNIASDMAQQRIAAPEDIDGAVTLGLGYPLGPLAWGDMIGAPTVLRILDTMHAITGDPRYRPSLWLRRRAQLGLSLLTRED